MHAASLNRSARLRRVLEVLRKAREENQPVSTMEIVQQAQVCAVNSIIAELRVNGYSIDCTRNDGRWYYRLNEAGHE